MSEGLVNLTCQVESNVDFNIEWRVEVEDPETGAIRRERLRNGDLIDMEPIEINQNVVVIEEGSENIVTSELIVSEIIFEMGDVDCRARSAFLDQSSNPGAFQPPGIDILPSLLPRSDRFPAFQSCTLKGISMKLKLHG